MRLINTPMRWLLRLPFATPAGRRLMLVDITGRRTGKVYRQPLSYVRDGTTLLTPGGGRWSLNLPERPHVRIRLAGRILSARAELVTDPDQMEHLLDLMAASNPAVNRFLPLPRGADGRLDRAALHTAASHGFSVVRWHLEPAPSPH
jgi:deazaflavin-dependent oxidoreductase (nitroreductase family)